MKDTLDELTRSIRQRFDSPLLGSFAIAWAIWNYEFLVVLLSDASPARTFLLIDTLVYEDSWAFVWKALIGPVVTTLIYIFVYPYPARRINDYNLRRAMEQRESATRIEGEATLSVSEARELREAMLKIHEDYAADFEKRDREILRLGKELAASRSRTDAALGDVRSAAEGSEPTVREPTSSQVDLLKLLSGFVEVAPASEVYSKAKDSRTKTEFDLGELEAMSLIVSRFDPDYDEGVYYLTQEGRRALVSRSLA